MGVKESKGDSETQGQRKGGGGEREKERDGQRKIEK